MNRALAKVFQRFDLAKDPEEGGVVPIQFFLYDRTTPVEADYFTLVYGGQRRDEVIPDESKGLRVPKYASNPPSRWLLSTIKDGDIAVRPTARSGPDIWFDTRLHSEVFISNRLVQALEDSGFAKHFQFIRCRVVEWH
ncbi:MAG: hypothetical protein U1E06_00305 [Tabrizicola sp.]|nr:hypothetical protein [Tabrizicola sp.]